MNTLRVKNPMEWISEMKRRTSALDQSIVCEIDVASTNRKCYLFVGEWKTTRAFQLPNNLSKAENNEEAGIGYFCCLRNVR